MSIDHAYTPSPVDSLGQGAAPVASRSHALVKAPQGSAIQNQDGRVSVAEGVVSKIAGLAAREISGVHAMGSSTSRVLAGFKERMPGGTGPDPSQGVRVELGTTEVAIDLDIVVEYGIDINDLARAVQGNVKEAVERMTGLTVTEVNLAIGDVFLGEINSEPSRVD